MKKNYLFWVAFVVTTITFGQTIFINEIHYDNTGGDVNEGVEICGPAGTDLAGWKIIHYNGNGGTIIKTTNLSGIITNQQNGFGVKWFYILGLQNDTEAIALVNPSSLVVQFISYEGVLTAVEGSADGMTSVDIGVSQNADPEETTIQLTDLGWKTGLTETRDEPNEGQTTLSVIKNQIEGFSLFPNPVSNGKLFIKSSAKLNQQVDIYSMLGKQVYSKNVKANEIMDVSNLTTGIYMIKVEEEGRIATRKLVVN